MDKMEATLHATYSVSLARMEITREKCWTVLSDGEKVWLDFALPVQWVPPELAFDLWRDLDNALRHAGKIP